MHRIRHPNASFTTETPTMRDNLRRYRAIRDALKYAYPTPPTGHCARHLNTLAALISGIVGGTSTQLPQIAAQVPEASKPESRVKRFSRWFDNDSMREEVYVHRIGNCIC